MSRTGVAWSGIALAVAVASGCGSGSKPCLAGAGTDAVARGQNTGTAYLTAVSAVRAGCADRVAFTFTGRLPGYRVEYRAAARARTEDASGRHVDVAGSAFLVVRLADAQTARSRADGSITPTYRGPRRLHGSDTRHVRGIVKTGDFEAVVTWAIGLDGKRPFDVHASGHEIVVDVG
jgi:hypothetical protein